MNQSTYTPPAKDQPSTLHLAVPGDANVFSTARLGLDVALAKDEAAKIEALLTVIDAAHSALWNLPDQGIDGIDPNGAAIDGAQPIPADALRAAFDALDEILPALQMLRAAYRDRASHLFSVLCHVWEGRPGAAGDQYDRLMAAIPKLIPAPEPPDETDPDDRPESE